MLKIEHLSYETPRKKILDNIQFQIEAGEILGIIGPNGAGKSTLLKLLSSEIALQTGSVYWQNQHIDSIAIEEIAQSRAVHRQHSSTSHNFSVYEMVMMGRYPHFRKSPRPIDEFIVEQELMSGGIAELAEKPFKNLSGGEQQRVTLSRAFSQLREEEHNQERKLLILDEPLNHLDLKHVYELVERIKSFVKKGHIAIVVLHDIQIAATISDKILALKNGKACAFGTPRQVLTASFMKNCFEVNATINHHQNNWHISIDHH
ncbi:MAG: ABC transporter ATP-binding protein [Flavobacteriales bacterium]